MRRVQIEASRTTLREAHTSVVASCVAQAIVVQVVVHRDLLRVTVDCHLANQGVGNDAFLVLVRSGLEPAGCGEINQQQYSNPYWIRTSHLSKRSRTLSWSSLISLATSR